MLSRPGIEKALARFGLAQNSTLVASQRERYLAIKERDLAIRERDQAMAQQKAFEGGKFDKFPAALFLRKRNAMPSRHSATRHMARSMICRERIDLKLELEKIEVGRLTENGDAWEGRARQ
jgi:hypothetical protein